MQIYFTYSYLFVIRKNKLEHKQKLHLLWKREEWLFIDPNLSFLFKIQCKQAKKAENLILGTT